MGVSPARQRPSPHHNLYLIDERLEREREKRHEDEVLDREFDIARIAHKVRCVDVKDRVDRIRVAERKLADRIELLRVVIEQPNLCNARRYVDPGVDPGVDADASCKFVFRVRAAAWWHDAKTNQPPRRFVGAARGTLKHTCESFAMLLR